MKVESLYHPNVLTADINESLASASRRMHEMDVGALAVLEGGELVGIVTERDIVRAVANDVDPHAATVVSYMTFKPAAAEPDEEVEEVAERMLDLGVRHLPVVRGGKVLGMLSMRDLLVLEVWKTPNNG